MLIFILSVLLCGAVSVHSQEKCVRPPRIDPRTCCTTPDLIATSIMDSCKVKYPMPEPPKESEESSEEKGGRGGKRGKHPSMCFEECAFNETGINVNGNIDKAVLTTKFNAAAASVPAFASIVTAAINSCYTEMEEMKAKFAEKRAQNGSKGPGSGDEKRCNPESGMLMHCMTKEMVKNCPADKEIKSDDCTKLKAAFASDCKRGKHH